MAANPEPLPAVWGTYLPEPTEGPGMQEWAAHETIPQTHNRAGSNSERQRVGFPGHCKRCAEVGHVRAHPSLGCGDVGCESAHGSAS